MKLQQAKRLKAAGYPQGRAVFVWCYLGKDASNNDEWQNRIRPSSWDSQTCLSHYCPCPNSDELDAERRRRWPDVWCALEFTTDGLVNLSSDVLTGIFHNMLDALVELYCKLAEGE